MTRSGDLSFDANSVCGAGKVPALSPPTILSRLAGGPAIGIDIASYRLVDTRMRRRGKQPVPLLVVDDEESILFPVREFFKRRGFKVDCATDSRDAGILLENQLYEALIVDLRLSSDDPEGGLDVVAVARKRHPRSCIIVLTAHANQEVEKRALALGADCFLRKPKPLSELAGVVNQLLDGQPAAGDFVTREREAPDA